eukprot:787480-Ditylum_brightwellii.AAC.1
MEDYLPLIGCEYCRIDGNTGGEKRDSQMDTSNAPNSSKFAFLLSTQAGGLGINLATTDILFLIGSHTWIYKQWIVHIILDRPSLYSYDSTGLVGREA